MFFCFVFAGFFFKKNNQFYLRGRWNLFSQQRNEEFVLVLNDDAVRRLERVDAYHLADQQHEAAELTRARDESQRRTSVARELVEHDTVHRLLAEEGGTRCGALDSTDWIRKIVIFFGRRFRNNMYRLTS